MSSNRFDYIAYDETAKDEQAKFKASFQALEEMVIGLGSGRYQSIVMTELETAYAFVGKAIRDRQIARNATTEVNEARNEG